MTPLTSVRPATLACLECRKVHLKCDGARPVCARCASRGLTCNYTTSRRGRRRGMQHISGQTESTDTATSSRRPSRSSPTATDCRPETHHTITAVNAVDLVDNATQPELPLLPVVTTGPNIQQIEPTPPWADDVRLVNLYYLNFHPNHPILVPRSLYWKRGYPWFLKAIVEFIGSHFLDALPARTLQRDVAKYLERGEQDTPAIVQARILYASILFAQNEIGLCQEVLAHAAESAISLGMYRHEFAMSNSEGHPEEEESLRRTWYEVYVLDGCVAASQRNASFRTATVDADVLLPCEDDVYDNGMFMPTSHSRYDFANSAFVDEEVVFSSFCYRIEAVRLLGRVLTVTGEHGVQTERVQAIDNALAAFLHHLPASKREAEIVKTSGDVDKLMFQTHMIIQYATILLHFPRSDLVPPGLIGAETPGDSTAKFVCPCTRQHVHSVKAIGASRAISMLAALRVPVQRHTPLSIYPLVLCAVVQLSICTTHSNNSQNWEQHRDCVKLILGVLKSMSKYWSIAASLLRTLRKGALRVFRDPHHEVLDSAQQESSRDNGTCPPPQGNGGEVRLEDIVQPDFHELVGFDELIGFDNGLFCF